MKLDFATAPRPAIAQQQTPRNVARPVEKRFELQTPAAPGFESVSVPYCAWDGQFDRAEPKPSLQIVHTANNSTMAAVMRAPNATTHLDDASGCVLRVFETSVPSDPFLLESPVNFGAGGIVKADDKLNAVAMKQMGFTAAFIAFAHPASSMPHLSFAYTALPGGVARNLVDKHGSSFEFWPVGWPTPAQTLPKRAAVTAEFAPSRAPLSAPTGKAKWTTHTTTILENAYFLGQPSLNFDDLRPQSTSMAPAGATATATPLTQAASGIAGLSYAPTATIAPSFLPNPTNYVHANVVFELKGPNQNVALSFANYGAVVGFAAIGAVALVGFAVLSQKIRRAAQPQTPTPDTQAAPAPQTGDAIV